MVEILANSLVPVFAGLLLGYVAGLRKIVDNNDLRTLITFVMSFAVPCALFTTIVRAPHPLLWGQSKVALVLALVYLAIYALMYFSARRLGNLSAADGAVLSLTLAFPNSAAIGIPLLPAVYGSGSSVSVSIAIAVGAVTISPINARDPREQHRRSRPPVGARPVPCLVMAGSEEAGRLGAHTRCARGRGEPRRAELRLHLWDRDRGHGIVF